MGRQLEGEGAQPDSFLAWVLKSVPEEDRKEAGFITSLVGAVVKHISEATTLAGEGCQDKEVDKEKEMILAFKEVLQPFLTSPELQLTAVYSLQVFCFSRGFYFVGLSHCTRQTLWRSRSS